MSPVLPTETPTGALALKVLYHFTFTLLGPGPAASAPMFIAAVSVATAASAPGTGLVPPVSAAGASTVIAIAMSAVGTEVLVSGCAPLVPASTVPPVPGARPEASRGMGPGSGGSVLPQPSVANSANAGTSLVG